MSQRPIHAIFRVGEELLPETTMTTFMGRMLRFKWAGVVEYWAVDPEYRQIYVYRLNDFASQGKYPEDFQQMTAEFFDIPPGS